MNTFSIKDYRNEEEYRLVNFLGILREDEKIFYDNLILSSIGARLCYSSDFPLKMLFHDERITNIKERTEFLKRLFNHGHFSVFAHSPIFGYDKFEGSKNDLPYKCWKYVNDGQIYIAGNARHLAEFYYMYYPEKEQFFNLFNMEIVNNIKDTNILLFIFINDDVISLHYNIDSDWSIINEIKEIYTRFDENLINLICFYINNKPFDWFSFLITNISCSFTHQLVRHTWQNFSQRSFRYTKPDSVVVPPSIEKNINLLDKFNNGVNNSFNIYNNLIENGIKKEDARFIIPYGVRTSIMASGPRFVFEDFVEKRTIKKAQWEIRNIAKKILKILELTS